MMAFAVMRVRSLFLLLAQRELERLYQTKQDHVGTDCNDNVVQMPGCTKLLLIDDYLTAHHI
jgi:hypothetical protein